MYPNDIAWQPKQTKEVVVRELSSVRSPTIGIHMVSSESTDGAEQAEPEGDNNERHANEDKGPGNRY